MKVSAKAEYACLAMLELAASHGAPQPLRVKTIADAHGIPLRFLVQILLQLKGAGLVASTRGASGGYQLNKPPDEISLAEVMAVIDGPDEPLASSASPHSASAKVLKATWQQVANVEQEMLRSITFADLIERLRHREDMYYI